MDDSQKKATLDIRHRTETSKAKNTTQIAKRMNNRKTIKPTGARKGHTVPVSHKKLAVLLIVKFGISFVRGRGKTQSTLD